MYTPDGKRQLVTAGRIQLSVGVAETPSITMTGTLRWLRSSFRPSCRSIASKIDIARVGSEGTPLPTAPLVA